MSQSNLWLIINDTKPSKNRHRDVRCLYLQMLGTNQILRINVKKKQEKKLGFY